MSALPKALSYFYNRLSITRNVFKQRALSNDVARPGDVVTFDLSPAQQLLDQLCMHFNLYTAKRVGGATVSACKLSRHVESLFSNFMVESAGYLVDSSPGQLGHQLQNTFLDYTCGSDRVAQRGVLQNHYSDTDPIAGGFHADTPMVLTSFQGFLNSVQPRCWDGTLAPLRISLKIAGTEAFIMNGDRDVTIELRNLALHQTLIDIQDGGSYADMVQRLIQSGSPLELPFSRFTCFNAGPQMLESTLVASLSTSSLDYMIGIWLDAAGAATPNAEDIVTYKNTYFRRGIGANNSLVNSVFSVNGVSYPASPANVPEMFQQTLATFGTLNDLVGGSAPWLNNLQDYQLHGFAHAFRFDFGAEEDLRLQSGLNTKMSQSSILWQTSGSTGGDRPTKVLFTKSTPLLRIGMGGQVEVVA